MTPYAAGRLAAFQMLHPMDDNPHSTEPEFSQWWEGYVSTPQGFGRAVQLAPDPETEFTVTHSRWESAGIESDAILYALLR